MNENRDLWALPRVEISDSRLRQGHCFDTLGCARVVFNVDGENTRSQRAVERIGAQFEGVMRHGWILSEGRDRRDVHVYSILEGEWPGVRDRLEARLAEQPLSRSPSTPNA